MKKIVALLLVLVTLLTFAACGKNKVYTQDEAIAIALKDAKLESYDDVHVHIVEENGVPCYNIHIEVGETTYSYMIAAKGGQILSSDEGASNEVH